MKLVPILLFTYIILITYGHKLVPYSEKICPPIIRFQQNLQTIFLDLDGFSDTDFTKCLLKNVHYNSIILISGNLSFSDALLYKHKTTDIPNVVIMTKHINRKVLDIPSVRRVLRASHRALVYIILTDKDEFKCTNGVFSPNDISLLEMFMNKLWHTFKTMRVSVIFPFTCKEKVAIYSGKRKTDKILYDRTIKLIDSTNNTNKALWESGTGLTENYPLKANIFYRFPTSITDCESLNYYTKINLNLTEGYCGLDALVMHDIVKHFKFELHFPKNTNCYKYGYKISNNITGSLGCIIRKELDISFNSRFMTQYSEDHIYFLHYVTISGLCAVIKRPHEIPMDIYPFSVYRPILWLIIISFVIIIGIISWIVAIVNSKILISKSNSVCFQVSDAFTSLLCGFTFIKTRKLYIFRGTCLCTSIFFTAMYQGRINHLFTTLLRLDAIKTLDALYASDYTLYLNPSMKKIMQQLYNPENKAQNDFLQHSGLITENYSLGFLLDHPRTALIGRRQDVLIEIYTGYLEDHEKPLINILDECFYTYYLSYISRSGFPFYEEMQRFMQRLSEAGLPLIYHKWTNDMLGVPHTMPKSHIEPRPVNKLKLNQQIVPFGILAFGHIVSLIIFIAEVVKGKQRQIRIVANK